MIWISAARPRCMAKNGWTSEMYRKRCIEKTYLSNGNIKAHQFHNYMKSVKCVFYVFFYFSVQTTMTCRINLLPLVDGNKSMAIRIQCVSITAEHEEVIFVEITFSQIFDSAKFEENSVWSDEMWGKQECVSVSRNVETILAGRIWGISWSRNAGCQSLENFDKYYDLVRINSLKFKWTP